MWVMKKRRSLSDTDSFEIRGVCRKQLCASEWWCRCLREIFEPAHRLIYVTLLLIAGQVAFAEVRKRPSRIAPEVRKTWAVIARVLIGEGFSGTDAHTPRNTLSYRFDA